MQELSGKTKQSLVPWDSIVVVFAIYLLVLLPMVVYVVVAAMVAAAVSIACVLPFSRKQKKGGG